MSNLLEVINAKYLHDKVVHIKFNNNEEFDLDLSPMIANDKIGIFAPLMDNKIFKAFKVDYTLCWGDDIDVAPEYFYFLAHKDDVDKQKLFKEWGYIK
jgi:hypothetical protein